LYLVLLTQFLVYSFAHFHLDLDVHGICQYIELPNKNGSHMDTNKFEMYYLSCSVTVKLHQYLDMLRLRYILLPVHQVYSLQNRTSVHLSLITCVCCVFI